MSVVSQVVDIISRAALDLFSVRGPEIIAAALVLVTGWWLSKKAVKFVGRPVSMWLRRPSLVKAVLRMVRFIIVSLSVLIALSILEVELSGLLVSMGVVSAIVALVLAPFVSSWISGFFILVDRPYEIGDMISLRQPDVTGFVKEITMRYTKIMTLDNSFLVIPNQNMRNKDVVNYSADDIRLRRSLDVTVTYECAIETAEQSLIDAAMETDGISKSGDDIRIVAATYKVEPTVFVRDFGDNGILLTLRYWLKEPYHQQDNPRQVDEKRLAEVQRARRGSTVPPPPPRLQVWEGKHRGTEPKR